MSKVDLQDRKWSRVLSLKIGRRWKRGEREGYGIRIQVLAGRGLVIDHVMKDSPAHQAGLQGLEILLSINTRSLSGLSADQMLSLWKQKGEND